MPGSRRHPPFVFPQPQTWNRLADIDLGPRDPHLMDGLAGIILRRQKGRSRHPPDSRKKKML
ncbi:MAG: hypothetical protein C4567_17500 [Deltaproteobacteria bacterium]|nr:MAG: hypothetical protein C4567_17500 [Deltaproteobacteria bacterium]